MHKDNMILEGQWSLTEALPEPTYVFNVYTIHIVMTYKH